MNSSKPQFFFLLIWEVIPQFTWIDFKLKTNYLCMTTLYWKIKDKKKGKIIGNSCANSLDWFRFILSHLIYMEKVHKRCIRNNLTSQHNRGAFEELSIPCAKVTIPNFEEKCSTFASVADTKKGNKDGKQTILCRFHYCNCN